MAVPPVARMSQRPDPPSQTSPASVTVRKAKIFCAPLLIIPEVSSITTLSPFANTSLVPLLRLYQFADVASHAPLLVPFQRRFAAPLTISVAVAEFVNPTLTPVIVSG